MDESEKSQARKYRVILTTYNLVFFISFGITLLTCFIVNLAVSHTLSWFFIVFVSLLLASSILILPQYLKMKYKVFILTGIFGTLTQLLLVVIDLYAGWRGWSFTIGLPIIIYCFCPLFLSVALAKYVKINWAFKVSIIIAIWLLFYAMFHFVLLGLGINNQSGKFWQADFSNWSDNMIDANVALIIDLSLLLLSVAFAFVGLFLLAKKRQLCNHKA